MRRKNDLLVLDLAPKLKRPLSLWNPLDYLRLLYWCFYFPQAIQWYVKMFGGKDVPEWKDDIRQVVDALRYDRVQRNLFIQANILTMCGSVLLIYGLQMAGIKVNWLSGAVLGVMFAVMGFLAFKVAGGVVFGVVGGITCSTVVGVSSPTINLGFALVYSAAISLALSGARGMLYSMTFGIAYGLMIGMANGMLSGLANGVLYGLLSSMAGGASGAIMMIRPDAYLINTLGWMLYKPIGGISPIPIAGLKRQLQQVFTRDTALGIANVHELLRYSQQFSPAYSATADWLAKRPPAQLIVATDQLCQGLPNWDIIRFITVSHRVGWWDSFLHGLFLLPKRLKQPIHKRLNTTARLDTPVRACCAGYWALHKQNLPLACEAFAVIRSFPNGEGLYRSVLALRHGLVCQTLPDIAAWSQSQADWLPHPPAAPLRAQAYAMFQRLHQVSLEAHIAQHSASRLSRTAALARASGDLLAIEQSLDHDCPELERPMMADLVAQWRDIVAKAAGEAGQMAIVKPVRNPFVAGNPVSGKLFVGREDVLARLEELWGQDLVEHPPSVVLFGHRRMGKTSILQNLGAHRFGNRVQVAYFSAQSAKSVRHSGELLHALATVLFDSLQPTLPGLAEPDLAEYQGEHYAVFSRFGRFLQTVRQRISAANPPTRVILTIDEFEMIEESIRNGYIDPSLIDYLRTVIQTHTWLVLALAGLHTLKEMSADYWHPLFASVTAIHISYLSPAAASNLLANPSDDFELDVTHEVANYVYALTHGQPFLTQLIGSYLVRRYNQQVFEQQQPRAPQFTQADVDSVVEDPEFYHQGNYYFNGIWDQARSGAAGQLAVLQALAHAPQPLPTPDLLAAAGLPPAVLQPALETLVNHDVIHRIGKAESAGAAYAIIVPLTRRWVANKVSPKAVQKSALHLTRHLRESGDP